MPSMFTKNGRPASVSLSPVIGVLALLGAALFFVVACSPQSGSSEACMQDERTLDFGFYAFFSPVSHSEVEDASAPGFGTHRGYESDIVTALEAMEDTGLRFARHPIAEWDDIWLKSASDYDVVGGGITILDSRTMDASGSKAVSFTSGHIKFRQSLLVRAEDAGRLASHDALTDVVRVGVLAGTTGEFRLLQLTGLVDAEGALVEGARIDTPQGMVTADGSADYTITAAHESPALADRQHISPPSDAMPQVVYLGEELGEVELIGALRDGSIDAIARGEIGNRDASGISDGAFAVTALDEEFEVGGFTLDVDDAELLSCIDERIDWLTDERRIGYAEWLEEPSVFMRRAEMWAERER